MEYVAIKPVSILQIGLIGAKILKDSGVRVNFTLGFSARQNVLATRVARPDYVNVFLGRISAYMINNKLGDGSGAGEKAVIASQNWVTGQSAENQWQNGKKTPFGF